MGWRYGKRGREKASRWKGGKGMEETGKGREGEDVRSVTF